MLTWLLATCSEVIDAMYAPSRYDHVYPFSYLYTYFVSVPHSILIQLASPTANKTYGECSVGSTPHLYAGFCTATQLQQLDRKVHVPCFNGCSV